jgi:hypothetical protein
MRYFYPITAYVILRLLDPTLCDKVFQCFAAGLWFSLGTPVSSTNKTDHPTMKLIP